MLKDKNRRIDENVSNIGRRSSFEYVKIIQADVTDVVALLNIVDRAWK